jgi:prepilin-type N-terminal cleavage/methylation domain-containing protein
VESPFAAAGFTLVELVAVIVLIGILSVFVAPRFSSTGSFAEKTVRDRMVAIARYAQQRAMTDQTQGVCYRFTITAVPTPPAVQTYGAQRSTNNGNTWAYIGPANSDRENPSTPATGQISVANGVTIPGGPINIFFDGLGNAVNGCGGALLVPANPGDPVLTININGEFPQTITISGAGYVQGS